LPPIVVHCSAGIGRTGTLIALFNMLEAVVYTTDPNNYEDLKESLYDNVYLKKNYSEIIKHPLRISVFGCVRKLREQRMRMVKKFEQYSFIYSYLERWLTKNDHIFKDIKKD
jgi:protein tyrosine phosphatase